MIKIQKMVTSKRNDLMMRQSSDWVRSLSSPFLVGTLVCRTCNH